MFQTTVLYFTRSPVFLIVIIGYLGHLGEDSESDLNSDIDGSSFLGGDEYAGEDRDVLDRELHSLAKEGNPLNWDSENVE